MPDPKLYLFPLWSKTVSVPVNYQIVRNIRVFCVCVCVCCVCVCGGGGGGAEGAFKYGIELKKLT